MDFMKFCFPPDGAEGHSC